MGKEKVKGERERRRERRKEKRTGNRIFLWDTRTVVCTIYRLPLRSICMVSVCVCVHMI